MSSSEPSNANNPPSRAYTIWTGKRPVIRPLTKPGSPDAKVPAEAETDADADASPESVTTAPSHAFTVWLKTSKAAELPSDEKDPADADPDESQEASSDLPPSRSFTIWTNPLPKPAAIAITEAGGADEETGATAAGSDPAPSTTPPEPERGGGGGLLGIGAAALVALVFGVLGYGFREDLKNVQQSNQNLQSQLVASAAENERLTLALRKDLNEAEEELSGKVNVLTAEKAELQKNLAAADKKLSEQVGALNTDKEKLVAGLAATEKKLADQVAKLTAEKAALEKTLAGADKKLAEQVAALNTGKANLEKKVGDQIDDLDAAKKDLQMRLMAEKTRIEGLLKNVQAIQGEMAKEKTANKQEFSKIRGQLDSAMNSIDKLIKALSGLGKPAGS